jgi:hypothetical protein
MNQTLLKRRKMADKYMREMVHISSHKGNANQNNTKALFHPRQNDYHKENNNKSCQEQRGKKNSNTLLAEM